MKRITKISTLSGYRLGVQFEDGVAGTINLKSELFGPMFEPLKDEGLFAQVRLDGVWRAMLAEWCRSRA